MERTILRLRSEFLEMPGLQLTAAQAQRLCGVDAALCRRALDMLADSKFLSLKANGQYARSTEGPVERHGRSLRALVTYRVQMCAETDERGRG
ncbi:MAG TPA: hypothetical protein VLV86_25100 [Vicinamibacterales bacterium]|nr:hypothetical protein [Vicinamibacterales bacterium]